MSLTGNNHPIVTRGSRVSRAPPHHILLAFLNLHGIKGCFNINPLSAESGCV